MKKHPLTLASGILCFALLLVVAACKKDSPAANARTIRYVLYTREDFSGISDTIRFRLRMQTDGVSGRVLLDSSLAPMTVSAVPDSLHALVFEKKVPSGHEKDRLTVGFIYDIDNVGESWYLDSCLPGQVLKTVEYSFR